MTDFWDDSPSIKDGLESVVSSMSDTIRSGGFPLAPALERLVAADGKMLRPGFLLLGAEFGRPESKKLIPLAAAMELLHIGTLIHDDILDDAAVRRGAPAFHIQNGTKEAVLTGDWLFSRCFRLAADFTTPENARNLASVVGLLCSSEIKQDLDKFRYSTSVRIYLHKIAGKTAALFSLTLTVGAAESGCGPVIISRLRRVGYDIGMAFQIIDDILDYESNEGALRKSVGKDLTEGLCTLPLIQALVRDDGSITSLLSAPPFSPETVSRVVNLVRESGALEESRSYARLYTERALLEISRLPDRPARETLRQIAGRLLERAY
jgi:heptaprenyl diphosphate synthase